MTTRRKRIAVCIGAALALLVIIPLVIDAIKPAWDITIIVDGNANQRLVARFVADGSATDGTLTLPFKQSFKANRFSFWLLPDNKLNGFDITLQILVNDVPLWPSNNNTLSLSTGVRGTLKTGGLFQLSGIEIGTAGTSAEEIAAIGYEECIK